MNYRHAYHAGNFADCVKHAVLVWLLEAMARKQTPFLVLDTHAGTGRYDLQAQEATRTGEWQAGIAKLLHDPPLALRSYIRIVRQLKLYPGSPAIVLALLRGFDRLVCCELHETDFAALRRNFGRDGRVTAHKRDGYEGLKAFLPPQERRALVLIDPPYEAPDEFERLAAGLQTALARFPTGVFIVWYPIKHRAPIRSFHETIRSAKMRDVVAVEFCLREPLDPARLNGCGLLVVNPPWRFEEELAPILAALLERLSEGEPGASACIMRLADE